jgi:hypothetical protein
MKRIVTLSVVVVLGTFAASSAWAKSGSSHSSHSGSNHSSSMHTSSQHCDTNHCEKDRCKDHCDKDYCDKDHCGKDYCKDKGNPCGNMGGSTTGPVGTPENPNPVKYPTNTIHPIVNNNPQTVSSNGFVWAGDHWERPRAGQSYTLDPNLTGPVVRDHQVLTGAGGPYSGGHGGSATSQGGVTVTPIPGSSRGITTLSGPGPIDALGNALSDLGSSIGGLFTTTVGDSGRPQVVDHRTNDTSNFGSNVRDHRN